MGKIQLFQERKIRSQWDAEKEEWYFSVVDVCGVLSESNIPRNYWSDLKRKLKAEGSQLHEEIVQLKLEASDGKKYKTDVLDTKGILRLIQSIPSKNAEPFKMWLAEVGSQRLDEMADPEKAILRGADYYRKKGYTEGWINQRLQTIEMRKKLTDEWQTRGVEDQRDYAILTNEMLKAWSGMTTSEYKQLKDLKKENLRDNMTDIELTLAQLAEVTTTAISKQVKPKTFDENKNVAGRGGKVAKNARNNIEEELGMSVVSSLNAKDKPALEVKIQHQLDEDND
ncbi:MAG: Bro-N domain-containing protein [Bacillota bacterium]